MISAPEYLLGLFLYVGDVKVALGQFFRALFRRAKNDAAQSEPVLKLTDLFDSQDQVLARNLIESTFLTATLQLISDYIFLIVRILAKMRFEGNKQTAILLLANHALSSIIVATRLGLWGAVPESFAIQRRAIESVAQLLWTVESNRYETAVYEAANALEKLDFDEVTRRLDSMGDEMRRYHGLISECAAHSTASSMAFTFSNFGPNWGCSRDLSFAETATYCCTFLVSGIVHSLSKAHAQENHSVEFEKEIQELSGRFSALGNQCPREFAQ